MNNSDSKKEKNPEDEIVVANMNVEGMPWYNENLPGGRNYKGIPNSSRDIPSARETWLIIRGSMLAGLLVAGIFSAVIALVSLAFCIPQFLR